MRGTTLIAIHNIKGKWLKILVMFSVVLLLTGCPGPQYGMTVIDSRSNTLALEVWEGSRSGEPKRIGPAQVLDVEFSLDLASQDTLTTVWKIQPTLDQDPQHPYSTNAVPLYKITYGSVPNGFKQIHAPEKLKPGSKVYVHIGVEGAMPIRETIQLSDQI
jgi:hypothetical protein